MTKQELIDDPNSCWNKAADDEPLFVLRAKDLLAPKAVKRWAEMALRSNHEQCKCTDAMLVAYEMEDWYRKNVEWRRQP